ncbi:IclR family transcriptional regulator [Paracoccus onubensis]|uniref:IclR family transcriptional regulator n=1 Tax=Paracoccus onubensis TaxID=1675788 RepID=A0A418T8D0_9RHOB|nr:IclR family transcriptional regulator [Paracoccus onubensis]RJE89376.1 IclR family transcriptional regulator [Paracoccus onubensis]
MQQVSNALTAAGSKRASHYRHLSPALPGEERGKSIQSVDRVLSIIEILSLSDRPLMLKDIANLADLNLSTCHHLINTLVRRGYVINSGRAQGYSLSSKFEILSRRSEREAKLIEFVKPSLHELNEDIREAVQMTVLRGSSLVSYVRLPSQIRGSAIDLGNRPLTHAVHTVANGKAILAWLPQAELARVVADNGLTAFTPHTITSLSDLTEELRLVRRSGFAVEDGEFHTGQAGFAAPVRDMSGAVVGSIGVTVERRRASDAYSDYLTRAVVKCANDLSSRMPAGCFT